VLSIPPVPVLTMRAFAEERRTDTLELLMTVPGARDLDSDKPMNSQYG
jgi:hypothetical protein